MYIYIYIYIYIHIHIHIYIHIHIHIHIYIYIYIKYTMENMFITYGDHLVDIFSKFCCRTLRFLPSTFDSLDETHRYQLTILFCGKVDIQLFSHTQMIDRPLVSFCSFPNAWNCDLPLSESQKGGFPSMMDHYYSIIYRLYIYVDIYISICLSIYMSVCLSFCLSIYLSIHLSI